MDEDNVISMIPKRTEALDDLCAMFDDAEIVEPVGIDAERLAANKAAWEILNQKASDLVEESFRKNPVITNLTLVNAALVGTVSQYHEDGIDAEELAKMVKEDIGVLGIHFYERHILKLIEQSRIRVGHKFRLFPIER